MDDIGDLENQTNTARNVKTTDISEIDLEEEKTRKEIIETYFCSICLSPPQQSCVCPCGHIFCQSCLMKWIYSLNEANCPKCRRYFKVEDILNLKNGYFSKSNHFEVPSRIKILRPGFSALNIKHSNLIIYQVDNKKPAFKSIFVATSLILIITKILHFIIYK
jgi:hypothetical protein